MASKGKMKKIDTANMTDEEFVQKMLEIREDFDNRKFYSFYLLNLSKERQKLYPKIMHHELY